MLKRTRQTFIVSDLHFNHANICRYCNRPYPMQAPNKNPANAPLLALMNNDILQAFEQLPADCDIWLLGDIFFYQGKPQDAPIEEYRRIVAKMKGVAKERRLFLIKGNHDELPTGIYRALGFNEVYDTPVIVEDKWILSHEPVYVGKDSHFINLYGHTHDEAIKDDYFTYDYENYARSLREAKAKGKEAPELVQKWPERVVDTAKNYRNCCLDFNKCILLWQGDKFISTVARPTGW